MLNQNRKVSTKQTVKLTILLQVRYHREKDKHRAGAHKPESSKGVHAMAMATAPTRYEASTGVTNESEASTRDR